MQPQPKDPADKPVYSVQIGPRVWGDSNAVPADVRAALNPGPQVAGTAKNEKNIIVQGKR
jgi:hypothetical protein